MFKKPPVWKRLGGSIIKRKKHTLKGDGRVCRLKKKKAYGKVEL